MPYANSKRTHAPLNAQVPCRGQGTIEYLVIIAVVVVVALVVVGLLISLSSPGAQVSQNAGKLNAEVQTISVLQAIAGSDGNGVLVIKNSSGDGITITKVTIGDSNQDVSAYFAQGDSRPIQLNHVPSCTPGTTKTYSVKINYTSSTGLAKTQTVDNVSIPCEATVVATNPVNPITITTPTLDTTPPTITLSSPTPSYATTLTQIDFNFTVSDQNTIRDCNFILDGAINGAGISTPAKYTTLTFTRTLTLGAHTWDINCTDATGNKGTSGQARTLYTQAAPVVYLSTPIRDTNSTQTGMDFNFWVSDADGNVNSCSFIFDGIVSSTITNPTKDTNITITKFGLTIGAHTWDINCTDANTNIGASNQTRPLNMTLTSPAYFAKKIIGPANINGTAIKVDNYGNIYVAGAVMANYTYWFDSIRLDSNADGNVAYGYVAKMNSDGNWMWVTKAGNASMTSGGKTMGLDSNGNIYLTGSIGSTTGSWFGPWRLDANGNYSDIFVAKLSSDGNTWLWAKRAGANGNVAPSLTGEAARAIAVDSSGNSYITGSFQTGATFDNIIPDSNLGSNNIYVAKIDTLGNWLWVTTAKGVASNLSSTNYGAGITAGSDGNYYVTGIFDNNLMFGTNRVDYNGLPPNTFVAKISPDGNWLWAKGTGNGTAQATPSDIVLGSDGNYFVRGGFSSIVQFGSTTLTAVGSTDIFIAKMDPNGNWLKAKQAGGPIGTMLGAEIVTDPNNNIYASGGFNSGNSAPGYAMFDNNRLDSNGAYVDAYVAKLNMDGNWLWAKRAGAVSTSSTPENAYSIYVDSRGIPYATGTFFNSCTFDSTQLDANLTYSGAFIWKLNPNG